jgi:hypothetical protein
MSGQEKNDLLGEETVPVPLRLPWVWAEHSYSHTASRLPNSLGMNVKLKSQDHAAGNNSYNISVENNGLWGCELFWDGSRQAPNVGFEANGEELRDQEH